MKSKLGGPKVSAIVCDNGRIVPFEAMKAYEVPQSKQLGESMFKFSDAINPPYDLAKLMGWMHNNVVHSTCVNCKVQDTVGLGWYIEPEDENNEANMKNTKEYKTLDQFFKKVNDKDDIIKLLKKVALDYEGCGNSYIEVARGKDSKIVSMYHVNATTIKWTKTKETLVQDVDGKRIYFKQFGEERVLDRFTGKFVESLADMDRVANEIIPITHYSWLSSVYGLPEWIPALYAMFGDMKEIEYNLDFFMNYGVPAYVLIMEGDMSGEDIKEEVTTYFQTTLKQGLHKTLTLSTPEGVKLRFEKLAVDNKESSFRMYKKDNRDDILTAHRVPPYRAAIVENGQLGGNVAVAIDKIYLDSVINPRQRDFEWVINELIIKQGLEIEGWKFGFDDITIDDRDADSTIHARYFSIGVLSANEIRKELGLEPIEGGDGHFVQGSPIQLDAPVDDTAPVAEGLPPEGQPIDVPVEGSEPPKDATPQDQKPNQKPQPAKGPEAAQAAGAGNAAQKI